MTLARTAARWPSWLLPFELLALLFVVATIAFLRGAGLRVGWEAARYTIPPVARNLAQVLFLWAPLAHLGVALVRRRSPANALRQTVLSPRWLLLTLRALIALVAVTFAYMWLKVSLPLVSWSIHDGWLWRADAVLHLGVSPNVFLVALFENSPFLLHALDGWYALWVPTSLLGLAWFTGTGDPRSRVRVVTSMVVLFGLGSWLYLAAPSLGPCYTSPDVFESVRADMPRQTATQEWLWGNYEKVRAGRHGPLRQFNPNLGVAAMPSLHVATHALIALWAWRLCRPLLVPALLATFLTFLGSILSGWHYAVDAHAGLLLAVLAWALSGPLCARLPLAAPGGAPPRPPEPPPPP